MVPGAEFGDNPVDHAGGVVEVVGVELDGESPAARVEKRLVPAASYAEVFRTVGFDEYEPWVCHVFEKFAGAVGRVVVDHNHVEIERGCL